ncbi:F-type H+-transporting ATPase subunit epsilon [Kineococcus radiotolerans]|uniref:ATP synthase epsilon chain n=2 Tax=Kineococcus radiotolerans TaxID=131568 RepID=A6W7H0_KINRD|nr:F0F1 ATP synthase subunit epsilon [Kineococcus radiotolerans]ABS02759.1 H+transporting two-sector ATPase delta/epsilon subunit [Kineococcus radiotolerans SRS30216 = ATCC BAA-149]MBB2900050.1 F-type H+-transporting ATPase subunit epsilon [Kineococcus radiotolerans]
MALQVDLVAADRSVWSGEASLVRARTAEGEIGIMGGHEPLLAILAPGEVSITGSGSEGVTATVTGGFFSVDHDKVTIVAESVEVGAGTR